MVSAEEGLPMRQWFLGGKQISRRLCLLTWVSHGDWLLFGLIIVDDDSNCIVESSP